MEVFRNSSLHLESNNNTDFQESCQKDYNVAEKEGYKCGEAYYVSSTGAINVRCSLCGAYFDYGDESFLKHIINEHFSSFLIVKDSHEFHLSIKAENLLETKTENKSGTLSNISQHNKNVSVIRKAFINSEKINQKLKQKKRLKKFKCTKEGFRSEKLIPKAYKCLSCCDEFEKKNDLVTHQKLHLNDLKANDGLICEQCGRKFARKNTLDSHYEIAHNPNRKLFPCNECDKSFTTSEGLMAHNRHYHTKELPFVCEVENCNKRYASQKGLKYHQGKHSNTIFSCTECNKQYSHKNKLQTHYKRHHSIGKTYHCGQCDKSFYGPYFLKKHMVCHTNERPFLCDQCPANFPRQKALVAHKKIHSGMRDEVCKLCGQAFNLYEGLYQHMKIRHRIKYHRGMTIEDMKNKEKEFMETNMQFLNR